ncbi:hypothetical protein GUITHDRAFT_67735 [Guillardia theta CCMP2712]|uniref:Phospholipid/glycerol acyltransferase domain-containing protein n=1 Tax=Guillardia theta (strain CCMP2712) TaxID=905079 RepID=L1JN39_GUITC|nr:hypothetical protein GUITHDRAFT_67735 [Guillardia theta CCMP2712]EKX49694.1 hypothetical protein GUITHDRAFT_67735 [Guillardia theta CCMP2712]|eukprot:XP_005836674.1 hypothetical protein GUITHDRAFT_67735 [Guillardia theta CCMP2712]
MLFALALIVIPGIFVNALQVLTLLVRPFSLPLFRKLNRELVNLHWPLLVWLIEGWAGVKLKLYGDKLPHNETMIGILNHRSDVDWMIGFALCGRKCVLGALKVIVKTAHLMIPVFGLMEYFVEFIFVKRNWQEDKAALEKGLLSLQTFPKPFWFIIFPEGTRYSQKRKEANQVWARENGKTPLEHVLWPRAKAFVMATQTLKGTVDAIYDATMIFEKEVGEEQRLLRGLEQLQVTFFDLLKGRGNTVVHFYVKR